MIYTSYFGNMKKIVGKYPKMVFFSIAGKTPDWFLNEPLCLKYPKLAPHYGWWFVWHETFKDNLDSKESIDFYTEKYTKTVLNFLNPKKIRDDLMERSEKLNVCLLCYEKEGNFCHRNLVREWFNNNLIECEELKI